ncbi:MAG: hypothetical protein D6737_20685 [Chloroflexi bacterium]|nr:MAG: hypothetical protein D6737_20685 [Chloroflexota bacterium]
MPRPCLREDKQNDQRREIDDFLCVLCAFAVEHLFTTVDLFIEPESLCNSIIHRIASNAAALTLKCGWSLL